jgi:hypothetical protein
MEVMAPASTHEKAKNVIHTLVTALRDELDIDVESPGSTALRKEMRAARAPNLTTAFTSRTRRLSSAKRT